MIIARPVGNPAAHRPGHSRCLAPAGRAAGFCAAGLLLVGVVTSSCKREQAAVKPEPPVVGVMEVTATNLPLSHEIIGQLDSPQNVDVRARVEAFVEKMFFTEGALVKEGDPLFLLDRKPFDERLASVKGQLAQARANLAKAEKDVERLRPLADKKAIPRQDLENALSAVDAGKAAVDSASAVVKSAELDLGYCDVRAPISGRIGSKQVAVGSLVGKGQDTLLATVSKVDTIWFQCGVSEVSFMKAEAMARGKGRSITEVPVTLMPPDGSRWPEKGRFVFVDRAVDAKTGTLRLRAEFANPGGLLRPGMFARIDVDLGTQPGSVVIPERAISEMQGRNFVWVVDKENRVSQQTVVRGEQETPAGVLIADGLKPGDRLVVEGLQKLRQGGEVRPMSLAELAKAAEANAAAADAAAANRGKEQGHEPAAGPKAAHSKEKE